MTTIDYVPTHDDLEAIFVNNEKFERIAGYLNRFNPIRIMKMQNMEIRHSAILAWLLDPKETHGLGDRFLKAFLAEALRGQSGKGSPTALDIIQSDLKDAQVRPEWRNIDILIVSPQNNWAFIVENKFFSSQRDGQLSGYVEKIKAIFEPQQASPIIRGVFLTLFAEEPQDESFAPIRYGAICSILPRLIEKESTALGAEVAAFLRHYVEIIRDATNMSSDLNNMKALARELYRSHRKVIDFINEHGAGTHFQVAVQRLIGSELKYGELCKIDGANYMYSGQNHYFFSFLPESWFKSFGERNHSWPGCENWWAGFPLICWIELISGKDGSNGQLRIYAEVGPVTDTNFRGALIEGIKLAAAENNLSEIKFQEGASKPGKLYSKFLKSNSIDVSDTHDDEEISKGIVRLVNKFKTVFDAINEKLEPIVKVQNANNG